MVIRDGVNVKGSGFWVQGSKVEELPLFGVAREQP
jgi:hypothetical protein